MCTVAATSGAASVRVWHITSRGWDPWTERPLPEVVRVAYPRALELPSATGIGERQTPRVNIYRATVPATETSQG
jgi:hypothetical protein